MDGLGIRVLTGEWNEWFTGARIEKVHQPTAREVVLTLRKGGKTTRVLLSAHRQLARAHVLRQVRPGNPQEPPMFCMLLRRRIEGGRVTRVWQPGWERILCLDIEAQNDIGDVIRYVLALEVMGKHSNLIFCLQNEDGSPDKIVDAIVHVTPDMSRVRKVLPGHLYTLPPAQNKVDIKNLDAATLETALIGVTTTKEAQRAIMGVLLGAGPDTTREALHRAQVDLNTSIGSSTASADRNRTTDGNGVAFPKNDISRLLETLHQLYTAAEQRQEPASILQDQLGQAVAAAPFFFSLGLRVVKLESFDAALERLYEAALTRSQFSADYQSMVRSVSDTLDRLRGKLAKLDSEREESLDADSPRIAGELLMAYLYQVPKGASRVELPNFYDDDTPLAISLDPALSATQNATRYFKLASKRKRALPLIAHAMEKTSQDMAYLESVLQLLEQTDPGHYGPIRTELERQGFLVKKRRSEGKAKQRAQGKHHHAEQIGRPDEFISTDGFTIRVGKSNLQNDRLTLKFGKPDDIWLHVKDAPGSHVLIEADHREVPETTLHEAALLAAYFSKLRTSINVPVDFTEVRHVWKPNGARPGYVLYDNQKTLYATPDKTLIGELLNRSTSTTARD